MTLTVRWLHQSFFQVRSSNHLAYIDPSPKANSLGDLLRGWLFPRSPRQTALPEGMGPGDLVLVTHHHADHVNRVLVEKLSAPGATVLATPKCQRKLGTLMRPITSGQSVSVGDLEVRAVAAYNPPGSRSITFHRKGECVGYVIADDGKRIYHAGDTGLIDEMKDLGPIDLAFLPIGGRFTMDVDEAVEAVKVIRPTLAVPMHMLKADPQVFKAKVERETATQVRVLRPGESLVLE